MIEAKSDASPVTEADRKAEAAMRKLIQECFPEHGIFGEEEGMHTGSTYGEQCSPSYLWVLDPIDGTKSFITGLFLLQGKCSVNWPTGQYRRSRTSKSAKTPVRSSSVSAAPYYSHSAAFLVWCVLALARSPSLPKDKTFLWLILSCLSVRFLQWCREAAVWHFNCIAEGRRASAGNY